MEMTLDVGRNVVTKLSEGAATEGLEREDFALNMMELGLRIWEASKEKASGEDTQLLHLLLENNTIVKEVLRCVFDRNKTKEKVFDAQSLLLMIENNVQAYLKGKAENR